MPSIPVTRSVAASAGLTLAVVTFLASLSLAAPPGIPGQATTEPSATAAASATATSLPASPTATTLPPSPTPTSLSGSATVTALPASPTVTPLSPSATATMQPVTPTRTIPPTTAPSATPRPPAPTCRLAGTGFSEDGSESLLYWSTVRNTGPLTVALNALQVGWQGPVSLSEVLLESGPPRSVVFQGVVPSPALVTLGTEPGAPDTLSLAPGATVRLGLRFLPKPGVPVGPAAVGPAVLYTSAGCVVALAEPPLETSCSLAAGGLRLVPERPEVIELTLQQGAGGSVDVASLEVRWPVTQNGALVGLRLDNGPLVNVGDMAASPALVDLVRVLGAPLRLAPGAQARLQLSFARPAAGAPAVYNVLAATRQGCLAVAATGPGTSECGVAVQTFATRGDTAVAKLYNRRPITRTLSALTVFWPANTNGPLVSVLVDGKSVWAGEANVSPASLSLPAGVALLGERVAEVGMVFRPPAAGEGGTIASGHYSLVAWLQGGCQAAYATAGGQPLRCSVSAGDWAVTEARQAAVSLTNGGAAATLRQMVLAWPRHNGSLTGAWLGGTQLFSGVAPHGGEPLVLTYAPGRGAVLPRNEARELRLTFSDRAVRSGYSASLQFDDPTGTTCANILVTSRPVEPDCALSLPALEIREAIDVAISLDNAGVDVLDLESITVDWPNEYRLINLTQVALLDDVGNPRVLLWEGRQSQSPATIRPTTDPLPILDAHSRTTLRLRYGHVLDMPNPEQAFKITVTTAEGCRASYAPPGEPPAPQQAYFGGVILALPTITGLYGTWQVNTEYGLRFVAVDRNTRFTPASVSPRVGQIIQVRALVSDGRYFAQNIEIKVGGSEDLEILEGTVTTLGPGARPAWLTVADTLVLIRDGTEIYGQLEVGAGVTVSARRLPGGEAEAETITVHATPRGDPIEFTGSLQEARQDGTAQVWEVDRFTVRVPSGVPIVNPPSPGSLPSLGARVQVRGRWDGVEVLAEAVTILLDPVVMTVSGTILAVPPAGVLGEWRVRRAGGGELRFVVESPSVVDTRVGRAEAGMVAHLRLQDPGDGRLVALRVRIDWPD